MIEHSETYEVMDGGLTPPPYATPGVQAGEHLSSGKHGSAAALHVDLVERGGSSPPRVTSCAIQTVSSAQCSLDKG